MTDSGEIAFAAPKGNAITLRQRDRITTTLCRDVNNTHTEGATFCARFSWAVGNLSGLCTEAQAFIGKRCVSIIFVCDFYNNRRNQS